MTLLNLEDCHVCQGKGSAGLLGEWHIICEACGGNGRIFRERAALMPEADENESG